MLNERLQILVTPEQRRLLETEARRRQTSVASLVRDAIQARFAAPTRQDRQEALDAIRSLTGRFVPPDELDRLAEREREDAVPATRRRSRRR